MLRADVTPKRLLFLFNEQINDLKIWEKITIIYILQIYLIYLCPSF